MRKLKRENMSQLGIPYPSLPAGVVKRLAPLHAGSTAFKKARFSKEAFRAVMQASDWFLEQVGDDLSTYAKHAGRKTIDETDVTTLMKRYVLFHLLTAFLVSKIAFCLSLGHTVSKSLLLFALTFIPTLRNELSEPNERH